MRWSARGQVGVADRSDDRGEANVLGLVLMTPVMLAAAMLVVWIGRVSETESTVQAASRAAAQAAARQRTPVAAQWAGIATAQDLLQDSELCAGGAKVNVDVSQWSANRVSVTVTCTPARSDVALVGASSRTVTGRASATTDRYRANGLP